MKKTAKEEQAQVTMEMISLRQSGDPNDVASATNSLPDVRILIHTQATSGLVSILGDLGAVRWFGKKRLSPWLPTLTRPFSNNPASADSRLSTKKCFVLFCPRGEQGLLFSFRVFVHDGYYLAILSPRLGAQGES